MLTRKRLAAWHTGLKEWSWILAGLSATALVYYELFRLVGLV